MMASPSDLMFGINILAGQVFLVTVKEEVKLH